LKKYFIGALISCFCCLLVVSCLSIGNNKISYAENLNEPIKYTLIGADFNSNPEETYLKYNISSANTSSFTPFDYENEKRLDGMSFTFPTGDKRKIENQYVKTNDIIIPQQENYSLFMWIHFDNIYLHNLSVTIEFENSSTLKWQINSDDLYNLIQKTSNITFNEHPYSWNKIEMPFNLAVKTGELYEGEQLSKINKIIFDYQSNNIISDEYDGQVIEPNFANLRFYDLYLSQSSDILEYSIEKQYYRFYKFNFFSEEILNSICVGDSIKLPLLSKAVSYAWNGFDDLKNGGLSSVSWRIVFKKPSSDTKFLYPNFGDTITFDEEGTYELSYQCKDTKYSTENPVISETIQIVVEKLKPVYFEKSSYKFEVGKTYRIKVYTSSVFSEVSDLKFSSENKNVELNYLGNGVLEVKVNKKGDFSLEASVNGLRPISAEFKEYTTSLKISAYKQEVKDYTVLKIVLWCVLGIFGVVLIVYMVKIVVKARKFDVK